MSDPTIKAIETDYNGYRFRSRLEARWAVFFDAEGWPYAYEGEGYDLGGGLWYLPDFLLTEKNLWVEVKGVFPSDEEQAKFVRLCRLSQRDGMILYGEITPDIEFIYCRYVAAIGEVVMEKGTFDPLRSSSLLKARRARFEHGEKGAE
jgi:hypothetical protein